MTPYFLNTLSYSSDAGFAEKFRETLKQYKIVHLVGVPAGIDYKEFYGALIDTFAKRQNVDEDIKTGNSISKEAWSDVRYDKALEFTFRHANTRQPLHTDAAYMNFEMDVNFFFCMENAEIGGATTFFDSEDLIYILEKYEPELYEKLKTVEIAFSKGENQSKTRRTITTDDQGIKLNWNYYRVLPENNPKEVMELGEEFHKFLENKIVAGGLPKEVYLKPGEAVFFHDDRILHGRNAFYGNRTLMKGGFNFIQ